VLTDYGFPSVPTISSPYAGSAVFLFLRSGFADQSVKPKADEEIHEEAYVGLKRVMTRQGEMSRKQEVGYIAQHNG
jgi:hypothetical protein